MEGDPLADFLGYTGAGEKKRGGSGVDLDIGE